MTFNDLAKVCEDNFYKPAVIAEGRKIAGVRSHKTAKGQIDTLKRFFGKRLINLSCQLKKLCEISPPRRREFAEMC